MIEALRLQGKQASQQQHVQALEEKLKQACINIDVQRVASDCLLRQSPCALLKAALTCCITGT